jgi:CRP-like cAMP-binding protein
MLMPSNQQFTANHILAAVPLKSYYTMLTFFEPVKLLYGQVLYEPNDIIEYVYFPIDCLISLLTAVEGNKTLEVGMVGYEGMVGMPIVMGVKTSAVRTLVQGSGIALRLTAKQLKSMIKKQCPLERALLRYNHSLMSQVSQTAACNRFHEIDNRLARWLLMTSDRLNTDKFQLTQEFLSHMLGVRREGVTKAANELHDKKLIVYSRGNMEIINHLGLEEAACSCYRIVKDIQDRAQKISSKKK